MKIVQEHLELIETYREFFSKEIMVFVQTSNRDQKTAS